MKIELISLLYVMQRRAFTYQIEALRSKRSFKRRSKTLLIDAEENMTPFEESQTVNVLTLKGETLEEMRIGQIRGFAIFLTCKGNSSEAGVFDSGRIVRLETQDDSNLSREAEVVRTGPLPAGSGNSFFVAVRLLSDSTETIGKVLEENVSEELTEERESIPLGNSLEETDPDVPFVHYQAHDYHDFISHLLGINPIEEEALPEPELIKELKDHLNIVPSKDREILANFWGEDECEPIHKTHAEILMALFQVASELSIFKRVSRATNGTLSMVVEKIVEEFMDTFHRLEREIADLSGAFVGDPEKVGEIRMLQRKLGGLEERIADFRLFHMAQVLRDSLQSSRPQPLETIGAVAPRSLESYTDTLTGKRKLLPHQAKRTRRPALLEECIRLYEKLKPELQEAGGTNEDVELLAQGLALTAKIAVEARGIRYLEEEKEKNLFRHHIERLAQQNRLYLDKFRKKIKSHDVKKNKTLKFQIDAIVNRLGKAFESLRDASGFAEAIVLSEEQAPITYERTDPRKEKSIPRKKLRKKPISSRRRAVMYSGVALIALVSLVTLSKMIFTNFDLEMPLDYSSIRSRGEVIVVFSSDEAWDSLNTAQRRESLDAIKAFAERESFPGLWVVNTELQRIAGVTSVRKMGKRMYETRAFRALR